MDIRVRQDASAKLNKKGIIRAGFTELIVTQNQVVLDYQTDNKGEKSLLKQSVKNVEKNTGVKLEKLVGDGGFGSEENYDFLEKENIEAYIKYNNYYKENRKKWTQKKIRKKSFIKINEQEYQCVAGKKLNYTDTKDQITKSGYLIKKKIYEASPEDCKICKYKKLCTKSKRRTLSISEKYERFKKEAKERLNTEEGKTLIKMRGQDVETVFADRKYINGSDRFILRGLKKVIIESGLHYSIHNIKKMYNHILDNWIKLTNRNNQILLLPQYK